LFSPLKASYFKPRATAQAAEYRCLQKEASFLVYCISWIHNKDTKYRALKEEGIEIKKESHTPFNKQKFRQQMPEFYLSKKGIEKSNQSFFTK